MLWLGRRVWLMFWCGVVDEMSRRLDNLEATIQAGNAQGEGGEEK